MWYLYCNLGVNKMEREKKQVIKDSKSSSLPSHCISRKKILLIAALFIVIIVAIIFIIMAVTKTVGKNSLYGNASSAGMVFDLYDEERDGAWEEGMVGYNGKLYQYNDEILTFLILGIDHQGEVEEAEDGISGGQSDAMFLAVCNPVEEQIEVIAINRNTMTEIERYNEEGEFLWTETAQITLQHGYGNGLEESCERSVAAVSNLFYQLPVHGYASINMGGIAAINDAIGGVEVTIAEDVTVGKYSFQEGETVLLESDMAYWYLKYRDVQVFDSATERLNRQKQYIMAFVNKLIEVLRTDITIVNKLYQIALAYTVTDVSIDEMTYMASTMAFYDFDMDNMHSLEGETITGEMYEEFYVDTESMYELILDVFYIEVDE